MPRNLLKIIFILVRHYQCEVKIIRGQSWFVALYVLNLTLICAQEKTHMSFHLIIAPLDKFVLPSQILENRYEPRLCWGMASVQCTVILDRT